MIKGAKVLKNTQIIDRFAPHDFLSVVRRDKTREILDILIGCMEPDRDYVLNLHQDEQIDDSRIVITNTVSFSERGTCHWEYPQGVNGWLGYLVCSSCGERFDECVTDIARYCPACGAKVVDE